MHIHMYVYKHIELLYIVRMCTMVQSLLLLSSIYHVNFYCALNSREHAVGGQSHSRLQQLVSWCGGEAFDGCLVFDECHKAKNFNPRKEERSTKVALAVSMVQKMLPRARVVYCSATGVSDVKNMVYI